MTYLSIDFINATSDTAKRLRQQRLFLSAARTDNDHTATAASSWASAAEAASGGRLPLVRRPTLSYPSKVMEEAWGVEV